MEREKLIGNGSHSHISNLFRDVAQVGVIHCVFSGDAFLRVAFEHSLEQIKTLSVEAWHEVRQRLRLILLCIGEGLELLGVQWEVFEAGPLRLSRGTSADEDFLQLFLFVLPHEKRHASYYLSEDAPHRPHVN